MNVFEIVPDFAYQAFYTTDPNNPQNASAEYSLNEGPMLSDWKPQRLLEAEPARQVGNFAHCWQGGVVVDTHARNTLSSVFEKSSELLPLQRYRGEDYYLLNVLNSVDCLDEEKTKWRIGKKHGKKIGVDEYHFIPSRLTGSTLFTIPGNIALFTVVGRRDAKPEFKTIIEQGGLTGLKFEEVWSKDGAPMRTKGIMERVLGQ